MQTVLRCVAVVGCAALAAWPARAIAASPPDNILVLVKVIGAVQRSGGYQHEVDGAHGCVPPLEIPPLPTPGAKFGQTPFVVNFDPAARPPDSSFRLELPVIGQGAGVQNEPNYRIFMTAGGRYWQGDETTGTGTFTSDERGLTGSFKITGLHSAGSADTISIEGTWSCPHIP